VAFIQLSLSLMNSYVISMTYLVVDNDDVYFAHCFPYTYSDLIKSIEKCCNNGN
jgi:hypothetical protein